MPKPFYITTPIYYVNARPHLGHAYTTLVADVLCRYHRMKNAEAFLLSGTDEHGDKVVRAAREENETPRVYVDRISRLYQELWPEMNIRLDDFIRTTESRHIAVVETVLKKIYDSGDIYFSEYEGLYCFGCERFYTPRELVDGKCPDHKTEPERIKESNYFFKMSRYQDWLVDHITRHPDFIRPERYRNEVLSFLKEPLEDLCISRPKTRLQWGITLPFDDRYVTYVWFDALLNYISALGYPDDPLFSRFWPQAQHLVAKDILKPHGIYWPIMLKAAGIPVYRHLNVHGYWNVDQSKMSKSLKNVIEPLKLKNIYGLDSFRFYLMRDMVFGLDSSFSETALIQRINSDLANDLGNLFSRTITMCLKYFGGLVPKVTTGLHSQYSLENDARSAVSEFETAMESFEFHKALMAIWEFINKMNKYIDVTAPWTLTKDKSKQELLGEVIWNLLEGLRIVSGLIYPVMPQTAELMQKHLGLDPAERFYDLDGLRFFNRIRPETTIPKSIILFPRIESDQIEKILPEKPSVSIKPEIDLETWAKVDLRVARIINAEPIPRAKKLLKIEVEMGERRTIVAGIAEHYKPEALIGRQILIVANLRPAKLMGILSNGMLLAASGSKALSLATFNEEIEPGTPVR
ncbi:MAG: methionine--tRNA ligase [Thermodesulfobacteriota bacterium]